MFIVVDVRTHRSVIVIPLLLRDFLVFVHISEGFQEFVENLSFGHGPILDLRVVPAVVDAFEVLSGDETIAVCVELQVRLVDNRLPSLVRLTLEVSLIRPYPDPDQELIEVDGPGSILVQEFHETVRVLFADIALLLEHSVVELFGVDLLVPVVGVEVSESSAKRADGLGASLEKLILQVLKNYGVSRTRLAY